MKKVICLVLAVIMTASFAVSAFAADSTVTTVPNEDTKIEVMGNYIDGSGDDVYQISLSWGEMKFTYKTAGTQWNTETHEWDTTEAAAWTEIGNTITVTNDSSVAITAGVTFKAETGCEAAVLDTDVTKAVNLPVAEAKQDAVPQTITVKFKGTLPATVANTKIGELTVAIDKAA